MNELLATEMKEINALNLQNRVALHLSEKKQASLAEDFRNAINESCGKTIDREHRKHLGASIIGEECSRYIWYVFHWVRKSVFVDTDGQDISGRMLRLFNRGHREEPALIGRMRDAGAQVWEFDLSLPPKADGIYQQFRVSRVNGHFGGSLDGIIRWDAFHADYMLLEMKTYNDKRFKSLQKSGVAANDPKYMSQMIVYGKEYNLRYAFFIAANKNDDALYIEIVDLESTVHILGTHNQAVPHTYNDLMAKAEFIINSPTAPPKLYLNSTAYGCKYCTMKPVCHGGEPAEVNCRSCRFCQPVADKQWLCHKQNAIIPDDAIGKAWPCHVEIK